MLSHLSSPLVPLGVNMVMAAIALLIVAIGLLLIIVVLTWAFTSNPARARRCETVTKVLVRVLRAVLRFPTSRR